MPEKYSLIFLSVILTNLYLQTNPYGRVAQLVQSTWFTPKGSGVRIPSRPQNTSTSSWGFFIKFVLHQERFLTYQPTVSLHGGFECGCLYQNNEKSNSYLMLLFNYILLKWQNLMVK